MEELYGVRPPRITALIAAITYELMIEEDRQIEIGRKKAEGTVLLEDADLKMREPEVYHWLRSKRLKIKW